MEQIRRANRLFANDSLFLREFLMVPVHKDSPFYPKDVTNNHHSLGPKRANTIDGAPSSSKDFFSPNDSLDSLASPTNDDDEHRKFMEEFLDKIDSSIASSKKMVHEQQKNSDFITSSHSDDSLFSSTGNSFINHNYDLAHSSGSGTSSYHYYQSMNHQSARHSLGGMTNNNDTSQIVVKTQGRHVKNSLQRLEKQQDEIFEL